MFVSPKSIHAIALPGKSTCSYSPAAAPCLLQHINMKVIYENTCILFPQDPGLVLNVCTYFFFNTTKTPPLKVSA